jgi:hypothetical protein
VILNFLIYLTKAKRGWVQGKTLNTNSSTEEEGGGEEEREGGGRGRGIRGGRI